MDHKKKFYLFHQSQHFCAVPWNHFEIFTDGSIRTCSKGRPYGNINDRPLEEILQSAQIAKIKQDLLNNIANPNCQGCHKLSTGIEHFDLRNHYNPMFKSVDIDYEDIDQFQLHGIDLHWDSTCNFRCVYCNAKQSSSIALEQGVPVTRNNQDNIDKIIDLVEQNQYAMKEIYLSGGEPLLIKHNARMLSRITNVDLPIRINSNISMISPNNVVFAELQRFRQVLWTISADNQGARFEYTRHGSDWNQFVQNLKLLKQSGHQTRLNMVWFVGNVWDFADTVADFVQQYGITDITVNQLESHEYLRARHAPAAVKQQALIALDQLLKSGMVTDKSNAWYNIARCQRELMIDSDQQEYANYFDRLDGLRGTDWRMTFPELVI